jgi:2-C-methyl-D-erythritol 2,4-cyclodiphosphate synthase
MTMRVGHGFDAHRLTVGRKLMLGGVEVPHTRGLAGHSDGDCLLHALCDALLGAAAAGDMGSHFPSREMRWKDAPSLQFLEGVLQVLSEEGWVVVNVDTTIVAEEPVLAPHLPAMRTQIAHTLRLPRSAVSVKAKSMDGLGAIGHGEGIQAFAVALVRDAKAEAGAGAVTS